MNRKEPCRNFQRGSCRYGDRCKFLHVTPQQSKSNHVTPQQSKSNPFGFGTQSTSQFAQPTQQQKPNPFGFGVANSSQLKGASNYGSKYQSPAKPFENKWTRPSATPSATNSSQQNDGQPQATVHRCTDPESCKRQIVEDFRNEAPLWKLTCYGHCKNGPCDIVGDVSFEELRSAAYDDARQGLSLQSIVERERSLLNSKLIEFDNLLRNPYVSCNHSSAGTSQFPGTNKSITVPGSQSNAPPSFSSFSQLGAVANLGSNIRTHEPAVSPNTVFGQANYFQNTTPAFAGSGVQLGVSGVGSQLPMQPPGSLSGMNNTSFNAGSGAFGSNSMLFPRVSEQFSSPTNDLPRFPEGPKVTLDAVDPASVVDRQDVGIDENIWLKEEWTIGEIPEEAPPERFC